MKKRIVKNYKPSKYLKEIHGLGTGSGSGTGTGTGGPSGCTSPQSFTGGSTPCAACPINPGCGGNNTITDIGFMFQPLVKKTK